MVCTMEENINLINIATTAKLSSLLLKVKLKTIKCASHINFLSTCLRFHLRPTFCKFKILAPNNSSILCLSDWIVHKWIDIERRKWYDEKEKSSKLTLPTTNRLLAFMLPHDLQQLLDTIKIKEKALFSSLRKTKLRKLRTLSSYQHRTYQVTPNRNPSQTSVNSNQVALNQNLAQCTSAFSSRNFAERFINLSPINFTESELDLLKKGKKFALPPVSKANSLPSILGADIAYGIRSDGLYHRCTYIIRG